MRIINAHRVLHLPDRLQPDHRPPSRFETMIEYRSGATLSLALLICLLLPALAPSSLAAQQLSDVYSARAVGMGGAYRALGLDASAVDLNPAAMTTARNYQIEGDYRYSSAMDSHLTRLTFVDNLTSKLATGVSWTWDYAGSVPAPPRSGWVVLGEAVGSTQVYRAQDYKLSFGLPLGRFAIGSTFDWHRSKQAAPGDVDNLSMKSLFSFTSALQLRPSEAFTFAVIGSNLVPTGHSNLPTTLATAVSATAGKQLMADVDLIIDFTGRRDLHLEQGLSGTGPNDRTTVSVNLGGQALLGGFFPLRAGFYTEQLTHSRFVTGGIGLEMPKFAFNYGLRFELAGDGIDSLTTGGRFYHVFSVRISIGQ